MTRKQRHEELNIALPDDVLQSKAARFNLHTLKRLKAALEIDPTVDLTTKFPSDYSNRLSEMQSSSQLPATSLASQTTPSNDPLPEDDIRVFLQLSDPVGVVFPLSESLRKLLPDDTSTRMSRAMVRLMQRSEGIWESPFSRKRMVYRCDTNMAVKAIKNAEDYTEYTTLQYLETHKPTVPAPRPLGLLCMNGVSLIFMTYISAPTLSKIWSQLDFAQKASIRDQLEGILTDLRSLACPEGTPFGGVAGEGCKDARRHPRRHDKPILPANAFENFLRSDRHFGSDIYAEVLRRLSPLHQLSPPTSVRCVFTHGDLRPDNITVEITDGGRCRITSLLDWEYSGFYSEYYESVKITNCLKHFALLHDPNRIPSTYTS
ncbi:phosphotransferase [Emydomyces testavorans]|uniref:Phosphotransferase n=1 Tax=Emydomyces testavorans TaxID=2070801 RepID=A0AAF0DDF8_9EURO|nr:phosphotransferase [Emydomyces testavorans]